VTIADLPEILLNKIKHFFESYKALEEGKWVKVTGWKGAAEAKEIIETGIKTEKIKQAKEALEKGVRSSAPKHY
jgi:inorganic pyrophosphatase